MHSKLKHFMSKISEDKNEKMNLRFPSSLCQWYLQQPACFSLVVQQKHALGFAHSGNFHHTTPSCSDWRPNYMVDKSCPVYPNDRPVRILDMSSSRQRRKTWHARCKRTVELKNVVNTRYMKSVAKSLTTSTKSYVIYIFIQLTNIRLLVNIIQTLIVHQDWPNM